MKVNHHAQIVVNDYPYATQLNELVSPLLENYSGGVGSTNVKATHTEWDWEPNKQIYPEANAEINKLKVYLINEVYTYFMTYLYGKPQSSKYKNTVKIPHFWGNIYEKGDYAQVHHHDSMWTRFSFAYFVKSKWYHSPFVFTDNKKRIRPKEGRYVIFPSYVRHHVPKHRFNEQRITLSGNMCIQENI